MKKWTKRPNVIRPFRTNVIRPFRSNVIRPFRPNVIDKCNNRQERYICEFSIEILNDLFHLHTNYY